MITIGVSYQTRRVLIKRPGNKNPIPFTIQYFSQLTLSGFVDKCTYVLTSEDKDARKKEAAQLKETVAKVDEVDAKEFDVPGILEAIDKVTNWAEVDKMLIDHIIVKWDKKIIRDKEGKPAELTADNKFGFAQTAVDVMGQLKELAENEVTFKDCSTELLVKNSNGQSYLSSDGPIKTTQ